jgi:5,10-methenyltetrahydromethanopterin hydrogenase
VNKNHDGITVCKEQCHIKKESETIVCGDVCTRNIPLNLKDLQLENMQFIVSQCNNNVLEITIPKIKHKANDEAKQLNP